MLMRHDKQSKNNYSLLKAIVALQANYTKKVQEGWHYTHAVNS